MRYVINKTQENNNFSGTAGSKLDHTIAKIKDEYSRAEGDAKQFHDENPEVTYGVGGVLTGAGLGAIANLVMGDKKKSKLKKLLAGALYGGLVGGALGVAGGGLVHKKRYNDLNKKYIDLKDNYIHHKKPTKEDLLAASMTYNNWLTDEQERNSEAITLDPLLKVSTVSKNPLLTDGTIYTESDDVKKLDDLLKSIKVGK